MSINDDKLPTCVSFILDRLQKHAATDPARPFILGLNGVQGVGKTTLVKGLATILQENEGYETLVTSIDDFYLARHEQVALAASHPDNALLQVRGEPGTHDIDLAVKFFNAIIGGETTGVPQYDKSAHSGKGDRVPDAAWASVNAPGQNKIQVLIFEGWCVGFRPLSELTVEDLWKKPSRTLDRHKLEHLLLVNERLQRYDEVTDRFDAFIYLDAERTEYVYDWRREQESMLRREKGTGMTDLEVENFVDAYYPAYELFSQGLREGLFVDDDKKKGGQLNLIVGKDRRVKEEIVI